MPGVAHTTAREFFATAIRVAGSGRFSTIPAALVRAVGLFHPLARSIADIMHLWEDPILLDGTKLRTQFPELTVTAYDDGIAATLAWHRANPDAHMY